MKRGSNIIRVIALAAVLAPTALVACPACGSANPDMTRSPLADGMNFGILTLLGVLVPVLGCFGFCFIRMINNDGSSPRNKTAPENITDV